MLDNLRVRGLVEVMITVEVTAVRTGVPRLVRCIKRFVEWVEGVRGGGLA